MRPPGEENTEAPIPGKKGWEFDPELAARHPGTHVSGGGGTF